MEEENNCIIIKYCAKIKGENDEERCFVLDEFYSKINEKITHQVSCDGIRTHDLSSIQFIICCQSLSKLSCTAPHHLNRRSKFRLERQKFKLK